jgi:PPOX class probable F420-dependent enzyme
MSIGDRMAAVANRITDGIRHKRAIEAAQGEATASGFDALAGRKYALVITYRASGEAVPTPVWFGVAGGRLYFRSEAAVGKVKRIRANGRARVAPCDSRGKPLGPATDCSARILSPEEEPAAEKALEANYGLGRKLYEGVAMNVGPEGVYVEVTPTA